MQIHNERRHASLGGSSADRWSNCPGSVFLKQQIPSKAPGEAALLGTRAHEALEVLLKAFLSHKMHGSEWPIAHEADEAIIEIVHQTIQEMWEKVLFESITDKGYGLETKFVLHKEFDMFGYADFWCMYVDDKGKKAGVIFDFKHGFHSVPIEKNPQLAFYACAFQESLKRKGQSLDYVRGIIYQPRVFGEEAYKETKFTAKQLEAWKLKFVKAGHQIKVEKKSTFKTGTWCEFCDAQSICMTYKQDLTFNSSLRILEEEPVEMELPTPDQIPDEELTRLVLNSNRIIKFLQACQTYAIERNLNGSPLPGTKLVETKTRRKWKDNEEEIIEGLETHGIDASKKKLLGITVIEAQLSTLYGKREAKKLLDSYTTQTIPSLHLVPESDERKGLVNSKTLLNETEE